MAEHDSKESAPEGAPLHQPKDKFARKILEPREIAISFIQTFLPWLNPGGDWSGLKQEPGSFISEQYAARYSDMLYSLKIEDRELFVYLLIEHKSQEDHWTLLYLMELMVQIWNRRRQEEGKDKKTLPVVIPIILHQGKDSWSAPVSFHQYFEGIETLRRFVPDFGAQLVDLADVPLETVANMRLQTILGMMKAVAQGGSLEWMENRQDQLSDLLKALGVQYMWFIYGYLGQSEGRINPSTIEKIAAKMQDSELKNSVMTWAESLREAWHAEGREEGWQEGLQKGAIIGRIQTFRELLAVSPVPGENLSDYSQEQLEAMLEQLKTQAGKRF
jgi:predicted transposase YdaD